MERSEDYTVAFEARKVSDSATKAGRKITFLVHPNDEEKMFHVVSATAGTRFQCVVVQLAEETDEPVMKADAADGSAAVTLAGMLCRDANFQNWILQTYADHFPHIHSPSEESAVKIMTSILGIDSRADLKDKPLTAGRLREMRDRYVGEKW